MHHVYGIPKTSVATQPGRAKPRHDHVVFTVSPLHGEDRVGELVLMVFLLGFLLETIIMVVQQYYLSSTIV